MKINYKYYIEFDEDANGYCLYVYDIFYNQFMFKGFFDNEDEAIEFVSSLSL